ncbi:MAG: glycosyltransferase family 9 protein [Candidatus Solibacter sp.]|nr:glycosyltransferase family 9 protein [Candidatus Solibacter sp.]
MFTAGKPASRRILVVRLGAMGDIVHTLPAVAWLKQSHPGSLLTWLVEPRWAPLLEGNPYVDGVVLLRRRSLAGLLETRRELRAADFDLAVDFQGLLKSAIAGSAARPDRLFGFHQSQVRERLAAWFYSHKTLSRCAHVVDRNLELAAACAGSGIPAGERLFPLPPGRPEGDLPPGDFVLASPLAGWVSKQWPMGHYRALAVRLRNELGIPLVLDGPPGADFGAAEGTAPHHSSLPGLIYATRRAVAIVGVDSGPLHLAAALGRPGVAIFGPTDPARNGPYGDSLRVLRTGGAATTYKRAAAIDPSMRNISPDEVFEVLRAMIGARRRPAGSRAE